MHTQLEEMVSLQAQRGIKADLGLDHLSYELTNYFVADQNEAVEQEDDEEHVDFEAGGEDGAAVDEPVPEEALQEVLGEQSVEYHHCP